ncbi:MAG: formylglycine-generating enzyme family protein [Chitinispirillaceae bacterium]|nr:formylglycine-generating enzyme family protein [Chitinispirillaceae bacterium]
MRNKAGSRYSFLSFALALGAVALFGGCSRNPADTGDDKTTAGMKLIPAGTFLMGDSLNAVEQPIHTVTVRSFYMDETEVTQADYYSRMGVNPSYYTGDLLRPVENMTWFEAVLFCNARSRYCVLDTVYRYTAKTFDTTYGKCDSLIDLAIDFSKNGYRLPTEAEWEYACRAGTTTGFYWGSYPPATLADTLAIDNNAIWWHNLNDSIARVGTKLPNAFGLYDMSGNVREWCNDLFDGSYYQTSPTIDPTGPTVGSERVMRGGTVYWGVNYLRSAMRVWGYQHTWSKYCGFRCVRR